MILAATNQSLEIVLGGAVAANQAQFSVDFSDITASAFTPGHSDGQTNNDTPVTLLASPGASIYRATTHISIYNRDTSPVVVTVRFNNNTTIRELAKFLLDPNRATTYSAEGGWQLAQLTLASDTRSGLIRIAGPGEVQGGTDLDTVITPGRQGYHKAMCKCWGKAAGAGTLTTSYNTTSVTDTSTGRLGVNIATDIVDANYSIMAQIERGTTTLAVGDVEQCAIRLGSALAGSFEIESYDHTITTLLADDPGNYFWACFGNWL